MRWEDYTPYVGHCPDCGKLRFTSRRLAKRAARGGYDNGRMVAYPCGRYWHFGHPPFEERKRRGPERLRRLA